MNSSLPPQSSFLCFKTSESQYKFIFWKVLSSQDQTRTTNIVLIVVLISNIVLIMQGSIKPHKIMQNITAIIDLAIIFCTNINFSVVLLKASFEYKCFLNLFLLCLLDVFFRLSQFLKLQFLDLPNIGIVLFYNLPLCLSPHLKKAAISMYQN